MGYNLIISAVISIVLLALSYVLYKEPSARSPNRNDQPTTLATRGEYINYLIGTAKTGYLFARSWGVRAQSSKSLGHVYFESGFHAIGLGPATTLYQIEENGKIIWKGPIHSSNTPSGTLISLDKNQGTFRIYWGEDDQPVDDLLRENMPDQIGSSWPHLFYIVWIDKKLGQSKTWGQVDYVWEATCPGIQLTESSYLVELYGSLWTKGINYAHAMYQILTGPFPWGVAIDPEHLDLQTIENVGVVCANEGIGANIILEGGSDTKKNIEPFLTDAGIALTQFGSHLLSLIQRSPTAAEIDYLPVLGGSMVSNTDTPTRKIIRSEDGVNVPVFTFLNQRDDSFEFRTDDVAQSNDAKISGSGSVKAQRILMSTITHGTFAVRVAQRREQESSLDNSLNITVLHGARQMLPGQMFVYGEDRYRIISVKPSFSSASTEIEATLDLYGGEALPERELLDPRVADVGVSPDIAFAWIEVPPSISGVTTKTLGVFRTRAHNQISGASIFVNQGGSSYSDAGTQIGSAAGGMLIDSIAAAFVGPITTPILMSDSTGELADVRSLAGDTVSWEAGVLLALIDQELFYLQSVTPATENDWTASNSYSIGDTVKPSGSPTGFRYRVSVVAGPSGLTEPAWPTVLGGAVGDNTITWIAEYFDYELNGLIRAQWGTLAADHNNPYASRVFILERDQLEFIQDTLLIPSGSVCVKSLPYTNIAQEDIGDVVAVCGTLSA